MTSDRFQNSAKRSHEHHQDACKCEGGFETDNTCLGTADLHPHQYMAIQMSLKCFPCSIERPKQTGTETSRRRMHNTASINKYCISTDTAEVGLFRTGYSTSIPLIYVEFRDLN